MEEVTSVTTNDISVGESNNNNNTSRSTIDSNNAISATNGDRDGSGHESDGADERRRSKDRRVSSKSP